MTDESPAPIVPQFTEDNIEAALMQAQGDLNVASQLMGHVTVAHLDRAIRRSDRLQNVFLTIKQVKSLPEYDRLSAEQLELEIQRRLVIYRSDAIESIHKMATMDFKDNSAMAQVALSAAARLAGTVGGVDTHSDVDQTLRELNERFHTEAPRIKLTRERTTIEFAPRDGGLVIDAEKEKPEAFPPRA